MMLKIFQASADTSPPETAPVSTQGPIFLRPETDIITSSFPLRSDQDRLEFIQEKLSLGKNTGGGSSKRRREWVGEARAIKDRMIGEHPTEMFLARLEMSLARKLPCSGRHFDVSRPGFVVISDLCGPLRCPLTGEYLGMHTPFGSIEKAERFVSNCIRKLLQRGCMDTGKFPDVRIYDRSWINQKFEPGRYSGFIPHVRMTREPPLAWGLPRTVGVRDLQISIIDLERARVQTGFKAPDNVHPLDYTCVLAQNFKVGWGYHSMNIPKDVAQYEYQAFRNPETYSVMLMDITSGIIPRMVHLTGDESFNRSIVHDYFSVMQPLIGERERNSFQELFTPNKRTEGRGSLRLIRQFLPYHSTGPLIEGDTSANGAHVA